MIVFISSVLGLITHYLWNDKCVFSPMVKIWMEKHTEILQNTQNKGKLNIGTFLRLTELLTIWCCIQHGQTAPLKPEKTPHEIRICGNHWVET